MPYGGNDWLALTQEPTLEPELRKRSQGYHGGTNPLKRGVKPTVPTAQWGVSRRGSANHLVRQDEHGRR